MDGMLAIGGGGGVVTVGNEVSGGGDDGVRVGTGVGASVGTGVTATGVIGTGVGVPMRVTIDFSEAPFFFWTRYHPAPPTITKAAIVAAIRIDLRLDGGIGGVRIDGFSG